MKTVNEKAWSSPGLEGQYQSPEKRTGDFNESIMVKMELEATMGLYRTGAGQLK